MKYVVLFFLITFAKAQESDRWHFGFGLTFSHFQQQVKSTIGDPKGERLVNINELGFDLNALYSFDSNYSAGLFFRSDFGGRSLANFDGFDAEGKTKVKNKIGGDFQEYWIGPIIRGTWNSFFVDIAYAPFAYRFDDARADLPSESGDTSSAFRTHPTIAFILGIGGKISLDNHLFFQFKAEYRVRYYEQRGDDDIAGKVHIGSQSIVPMIGLIWEM